MFLEATQTSFSDFLTFLCANFSWLKKAISFLLSIYFSSLLHVDLLCVLLPSPWIFTRVSFFRVVKNLCEICGKWKPSMRKSFSLLKHSWRFMLEFYSSSHCLLHALDSCNLYVFEIQNAWKQKKNSSFPSRSSTFSSTQLLREFFTSKITRNLLAKHFISCM